VLCFDVFEFDFLLFAVHLDTVRVMTFYISDVLILVFRLCSLLMSTDKEFDCSWEDIKRIDREWKQRWYEFGYQTLQNQIDSLSEENGKIEDTRQSHRRRIFELENSVRELQDEIGLGIQTLVQNLNKRNYLCCEMERKKKNEEEFLISDPKFMPFYYKAEAIIEEKFNQSKQMMQSYGGFCGCGLDRLLTMQKGSHRKNEIHILKVKRVSLHLMRVDQVLQILVKVIKFGEEWLVECIIPFLFPQLEWKDWEELVKERRH